MASLASVDQEDQSKILWGMLNAVLNNDTPQQELDDIEKICMQKLSDDVQLAPSTPQSTTSQSPSPQSPQSNETKTSQQANEASTLIMDDPRLIIDYHKDGVNVIIDYNGTRSEVTLTDSNSLLSEVRNLISGANVEILIIHNDPTE